MDMDTSDSSNKKSSAFGSGEMSRDSLSKQWSVVNEVEMHVEAIQNLVKGQKQILEQLQSQFNNENNLESGNSVFLSELSSHVEKIRKVINDEGQSSISAPANQAEDVAVVAEKALKNSVVLRTIMSYLDAVDLLCCRLVTKSWKEEADIQLLSGHLGNKVEFWWDTEEQNFKNRRGTFKEFTECCYGDPHRKFPCSEFHISLWEYDTVIEETQADLLNFFSKFGHHIKSLQLECSSNSALAFKIMNKIIFELTPNLKSFTFGYTLDDDEQLIQADQQMPESEKNESQVSTSALQNLQELRLENCNPGDPEIVAEKCKNLVSRILASAPNINRVSDLCSNFTNEIVAAGKIGVLDSIDVVADFAKMDLYAEFARGCPQLVELNFYLEEAIYEEFPIKDFFSSLQLILESSQKTLKTLTLFNRLHLKVEKFVSLEKAVAYQRLKFAIPILENLRELKLICWKSFEGGAGWILPVGFSFQVIFPRLKNLSFERIGNEEENYDVGRTDNPFTNGLNSSTTVEKLNIGPEFNSFFHLEWINQTRVLYPNVRVLHLEIKKNWTEFPQICSRIWKSWNGSSLEKLKFNIECVTDNESNRGFAEIMDQALTGFDIPTCKMLRKQPGSKQYNEEFKRDSSVLDMTNLKLLQLSGTPTGGFSLFSRVSVIHAFDPMKKRQNLRVVINGAELEDMIQERNVDFRF